MKKMTWKPRSHSRSGRELVWAESRTVSFLRLCFVSCTLTLRYNSLAWMELNLVLSKLLFVYDLELLDEKLDWHRDSRMATLWQKPELRVKVIPRR